jgi:hypothetical protein
LIETYALNTNLFESNAGVVNVSRSPLSITSTSTGMPAIFTVVVASKGGCGHVRQFPPIATMRSFPFVVSEVVKDEVREQFVSSVVLTQKKAIDGCRMPRTVTGIEIKASWRPALELVTEHSTVTLRSASCTRSHLPMTSNPVRPFCTAPLVSIVMGAGTTSSTSSYVLLHATVMISSGRMAGRGSARVRSVLGFQGFAYSIVEVVVVYSTYVARMCVGAEVGAEVGEVEGAAVGARDGDVVDIT